MRTGEGTPAPGGRAPARLLGISPLPQPQGSQVSLGGCFRSLLHSGFQVVPTPPPPHPRLPVLGGDLGIGDLQVRMGVRGLPQLGRGSMLADWVLCSWQPIMKFINDQYEKYLQEVNINRKKRIPTPASTAACTSSPPYRPLVRAPSAQPECPRPPSGLPTSAPCPTHRSPSSLPGRAEDRLGPVVRSLGCAFSGAGVSGGPGRWAWRLSSCVSLALTCPPPCVR